MDDNKLIEDSGFVNPTIKLKELEMQTTFDYNVPVTGEFKCIIDRNCEVCANEDITNYVAKYLSSKAPTKTIKDMVFYKFGKSIDLKEFENHRKHITCEFKTDLDIQAEAIEELNIIESDISTKIDENIIIENQIRQLYALTLQAKKLGDMDKALQYTQQLRQWIVLKKKANNELSEGSSSFMIGDMIKIDSIENNNGIDNGRKHGEDIVTDSRIINTKKEIIGITGKIKKDYKQ